MFYKNLNMFGILSFEQKHYKDVVQSIKDSRGYISYIDAKTDKGNINARYQSYVILKQAAYTTQAPKRNQDDKMNKMYTTLMPKSVNQEQVNTFLKEHGMHSDYEYEYEITHKDEHSYTALHQVIPIEHSVFDTALDLDDNFEKLNRQYLNEEFLLKNHQRFTLLPFLGKFEGNYVKPVVIANVYDAGIITIQISVGHAANVAITDSEPNLVVLEDLEFYQIKSNYSSRDFWKREKVSKGTIYKVMDYYMDQLEHICGNFNLVRNTEKQIAWVFGDFNPNKRFEHNDFVKKHQNLYASHLINAPKQLIERMTDEKIEEVLKTSQIEHYKSMHFYCSEVISLLSFSHSAFHQEAAGSLKEAEKDLRKQGIYNEMLIEQYKEQSLYTMFEFLRFYELTFIKKYYAIKLLNKLSRKTIRNLKEYNSIRNEFNSLKINYDQQLLFKSHGSPTLLYGKLLEKSGTENVVEKVEKLFSNAREDVSNAREHAIKQSETYILIMTSLLTVLLGYRGIKYIVEDILINLPYIGTIFSLHPLRWTFCFWIALIFSMVFLNIFRYKAIKS
ncbi:hypothetical protein AB5I83_17790 [Mesobacillus sp. LC4]